MKRNPKWHRDEIILTLHFYFSKDRGSIDARNPKVIELSRMLNRLPIVTDRPDKEKFRNPNGVSMKLSNFLAVDPNHSGKGMTRGSKMDKQVFFEFNDKKELLKTIAAEITRINNDDSIRIEILSIEEDEQTWNDTVAEGSILYKLHKSRERSAKIVQQKKKRALVLFGKLVCEICEFDFYERYGELGIGFIECHHRTPLSSLQASSKTSLKDLALVCANCHRMLHKKIDVLSIEDLKALINR
ncbi:HNH endonuclease [Chitinophaga sp. SYP-B3965]|uniref:HNH endonuclease n=1 Tax=Chitinophaga sp. SYP-B3965 TaxID=2663120 RepID=UPI001299B94F|nr:HNH endonuclease [Chitinophaga sp. SYP-B3965]MRG45026.1 HNH endonuclease [Chitinophaga sp. SYP-B3965]